MYRKEHTPQQRQKLRCAIYTRKSSEEGLEQSFNSLHAQRDACAMRTAKPQRGLAARWRQPTSGSGIATATNCTGGYPRTKCSGGQVGGQRVA